MGRFTYRPTGDTKADSNFREIYRILQDFDKKINEDSKDTRDSSGNKNDIRAYSENGKHYISVKTKDGWVSTEADLTNR